MIKRIKKKKTSKIYIQKIKNGKKDQKKKTPPKKKNLTKSKINITDKKIELLRIGTSETVNLENRGLPFTYDNNDALLEANNQSMNSSIANPNGSANPYEGTF